MKPTVLFLFNSSMYAVQPWLDLGGFNCVSVDYEDTDHSGPHRVHKAVQGHTRLTLDLSSGNAYGKIEQLLRAYNLMPPSFILSFAPCTDISVAGARHYASKLAKDPLCQVKAVKAAKLVLSWTCPSIVENPISVLSTMWKKPTGYVHPWHFSHLLPHDDVHPEFPNIIPPRDWYNKKTGLWCSNGAKMPVSEVCKGGPLEVFPGWAKLGGKSARTKYIRSLTPRGMATAIAWMNGPLVMATHRRNELIKGDTV